MNLFTHLLCKITFYLPSFIAQIGKRVESKSIDVNIVVIKSKEKKSMNTTLELIQSI